MSTIKILCPAKINLTLDIVGIRDNGYHNVKMILQTVSLFDEVTVTLTDSSNIEVKCNVSYVPTDERNIAYKAAKAFFETTKIKNKGIIIKIYKKIPIAAGLAGGSANAAGVIIALNKLLNTNLSPKRMCEIGFLVGADVPFCIIKGTALVEGLGEKITPLENMPNCYFVIAKPPVGISTPLAYKAMDEMKIIEHPDIKGVFTSLKNNDLNGIARRVFNVMEIVSIKLVPQIVKIKSIMTEFNPLGIVMSGSGTSVVAIFNNEKTALLCENILKKKYKEVYLCKPYNIGVF